MDQPPAGLAIQGLLRPAFLEEHAVIQKHMSDNHSSNDNTSQTVNVEGHGEDAIHINGHKPDNRSAKEAPGWVEELEKDETLVNVTSFYKLEMVKVQLISSHGHQVTLWFEVCFVSLSIT